MASEGKTNSTTPIPVESVATMLSADFKNKEEALKESTEDKHKQQEKHKLLVGYTAFRKYVDGLKANKDKITYFLFEGQRDSSGNSWCPDCNAAEPHIEAAWKKYKTDNSEFIVVDTGSRAEFKDKDNPFRSDKDVHVNNIPTLILWKTQRRLGESQLLKDDLLEMFFTEDD